MNVECPIDGQNTYSSEGISKQYKKDPIIKFTCRMDNII